MSAPPDSRTPRLTCDPEGVFRLAGGRAALIASDNLKLPGPVTMRAVRMVFEASVTSSVPVAFVEH